MSNSLLIIFIIDCIVIFGGLTVAWVLLAREDRKSKASKS